MTLRINIELSEYPGCSASTRNRFHSKFSGSLFERKLSCHSISQRRPIINSGLDFIAWTKCTDAGGRSGQNHVPRKQCQPLACKRHDFRDRINHLACAGVLLHLTVLPECNVEIGRVDSTIDERSYRSVGVERFAASKLLFRLLQISVANVLADGVTKDEIECAIPAHIFCCRRDHDGELNL